MAEQPAPPASKCPTCRKQAARENNQFFPFCTERCQLQDLGRWLDNGYSIPGDPAYDEGLDSSKEDDEFG